MTDRLKYHDGLGWASSSKKIAYLGIPKTASSSMRKFLGNDRVGFDFNDKPNDYHTFTVLRNPLNRFVSGMYESMKRSESPQEFKNLSQIQDTKQLIIACLDLIDKVGFIEVHTAPQTFFFKEVDDVLIFENISSDMKAMCDKVELIYELPHENKGRDAHGAVQIIKDDQALLDRVNEMYSGDWELYIKYGGASGYRL